VAADAGTAVTATKPAALKMRPTMTLREIFFMVVDSFGSGHMARRVMGRFPRGRTGSREAEGLTPPRASLGTWWVVRPLRESMRYVTYGRNGTNAFYAGISPNFSGMRQSCRRESHEYSAAKSTVTQSHSAGPATPILGLELRAWVPKRACERCRSHSASKDTGSMPLRSHGLDGRADRRLALCGPGAGDRECRVVWTVETPVDSVLGLDRGVYSHDLSS
jgi:hypothetical protein